jgi:hypothetical protein
MRIALLDIVMYPKKRSTLSRKAEPPTAGLGRRRVWQALCILAFTCLLKDYSVAAENYKPTHYKQYILIELNNFEQAYCLIELYHNESRFNPLARNGSHYGIPQGRSKYLSRVDGIKQIDWGIKYNLHRYGSMCAALNHFKIKGWH